MPIRVAVPKETAPGEHRVALIPSVAEKLAKLGAEVVMERGAGAGSYCRDEEYAEVQLMDNAEQLYKDADIILKVQPPTMDEIKAFKEGATVIGFMQPHRHPEEAALMRDRKITSFAMELVPRISRAQSMDALSSQASVGGYKAALMAANLTARFFPMLTTAAGTIRPSKVLVIGAGVAGLQAIATARRLGAIVEAYDIRAAAKEQVESLGAKLVDTGVNAEAAGGYARELTEEEKAKQAEALAKHVAAADAVISTASVPGRPAPKILSGAMIEGMKDGSVIIDLAAETGGNCELTKPGEQYLHNGVTIYGPLNVASMLPVHASEMYAKNVLNFLTPMFKDGNFEPDWEDEVVTESALTHQGEIRHEPTRKLVEGEQQ